jgi:hypothetical protein
MAQLVLTMCDLCADQDTATPARPGDVEPGTPYVLTIGEGAAPLVIDLCPDHAAELLSPLQTVLADHGRRLPAADPKARPSTSQGRGPYKPRAGASTGPIVCLLCGHRTGTPGGLSQHYQRSHGGMSAGDVYGEDPAVCPLCDHTSSFTAGIALHAVDHGLGGDGASHRLWSTAIDQGDPTGAVAKRRAELGVRP